VNDSPVRDLERVTGVGDVDQTEVAAALLIAEPGGAGGVRVFAGRHRGVGERPAQVLPVLDLELVHAARAASGVDEPQFNRIGGIRHVPQHQATRERGVVSRAAADLDPTGGDVLAGQRPEFGCEHHDVLDRGAFGLIERRDHHRAGGVGHVDHGDPVVLIVGAEPLLRALGPVGEAPPTDVGESLVEPDVGVEAATSQVGVTDDLHVEGLTALLAPRELFVRLLQAMELVLQQLVLVLWCGERAGRREQRDRRRQDRAEPDSAHGPSPFGSDLRFCRTRPDRGKPVRSGARSRRSA
jgi:hypothetical protein